MRCATRCQLWLIMRPWTRPFVRPQDQHLSLTETLPRSRLNPILLSRPNERSTTCNNSDRPARLSSARLCGLPLTVSDHFSPADASMGHRSLQVGRAFTVALRPALYTKGSCGGRQQSSTRLVPFLSPSIG